MTNLTPEGRAAIVAANKKSKTTHGLTQHPLYGTWTGMMNRCYNTGQKSYRDYGARGVTVHAAWHDVRNFVADIERTIGPKPGPELTLDRIDGKRGYEPGNVRWATRMVQAANRRIPRNSLAIEEGQRFGRGVVLREESRRETTRSGKVKSVRWAVLLCDCGTEYVARTSNLFKNTQSCGCLRREQGKHTVSTAQARRWS